MAAAISPLINEDIFRLLIIFLYFKNRKLSNEPRMMIPIPVWW